MNTVRDLSNTDISTNTMDINKDTNKDTNTDIPDIDELSMDIQELSMDLSTKYHGK